MWDWDFKLKPYYSNASFVNCGYQIVAGRKIVDCYGFTFKEINKQNYFIMYSHHANINLNRKKKERIEEKTNKQKK